MSRIKTVSRAHTVSEKVAMTTKNDGLETGALTNSPQVTIALLAEPTFPDRDDRRSRHSATGTFPATHGLRLRGKLRDGAGKLRHVLGTARHMHGNLRRHAAAARQSQLTIPWCPTRDLLSEACCPSSSMLGIATRALLQGRHTVKPGHRSITGSGQGSIRSTRADTQGTLRATGFRKSKFRDFPLPGAKFYKNPAATRDVFASSQR